MIIKVLGKSHREGISKKSGKPYNFNEVHYLGKAYGVEGQAGCTCTLDPAVYPLDQIIIGREYNVERDNRGYILDFTPVVKQ